MYRLPTKQGHTAHKLVTQLKTKCRQPRRLGMPSDADALCAQKPTADVREPLLHFCHIFMSPGPQNIVACALMFQTFQGQRSFGIFGSPSLASAHIHTILPTPCPLVWANAHAPLTMVHINGVSRSNSFAPNASWPQYMSTQPCDGHSLGSSLACFSRMILNFPN